MAWLASPWSPSSLQLQFGQRSAKPSPVLFKIRFRPSTRRILLASANGGDGQSWASGGRLQDSFVGWSGSDCGDRGGGDPKKNEDRSGGMLGAGLAGVFFTAGITFASLSLSTKATSGVKQQMEPLTTEQEVILTSDEQIEKLDQIRNEASMMLPDKQSKTDYCNSKFQKALQVPPGKVLVPAVVDQVQGQALTALQVLKVIEGDAQPSDLCTRREYARWLLSASSALSRNTTLKVYPAMYIENVTDLAFDDVTPDDPDYSCIQGLAEAGIISSKLSKSELDGTSSVHQNSFFFSPGSPVSRQDLVSWKMALERRQLPEVDRNYLYQCSGYIDIDKIDRDAWPALVADLYAGEQGITALAFGFSRLFQPNKPVTKAQAAVALATGDSAEVIGEELTRVEAESLAETAVNTHTALVAQIEKELNASFETELAREREKINSLEKLAEEARLELARLKAERAKEHDNLVRRQAAVESEMEVLSRLRHEVEEELQDLMNNKIEISFERDRISKLREEAESENRVIVQLQYELEVERKALSMARAWAEEEAKKAREQARALEEARDRWKRHGIKVIVDENLQGDASTGVTWLTVGQLPQVNQTVNSAENLVEKLKAMASEIKIKSSAVVERIIQKILSFITALKGMGWKASGPVKELLHSIVSKASRSIGELKDNTSGISSNISDKTRRAVEDCKESIGKFSQKFKS